MPVLVWTKYDRCRWRSPSSIAPLKFHITKWPSRFRIGESSPQLIAGVPQEQRSFPTLESAIRFCQTLEDHHVESQNGRDDQ